MQGRSNEEIEIHFRFIFSSSLGVPSRRTLSANPFFFVEVFSAFPSVAFVGCFASPLFSRLAAEYAYFCSGWIRVLISSIWQFYFRISKLARMPSDEANHNAD